MKALEKAILVGLMSSIVEQASGEFIVTDSNGEEYVISPEDCSYEGDIAIEIATDRRKFKVSVVEIK